MAIQQDSRIPIQNREKDKNTEPKRYRETKTDIEFVIYWKVCCFFFFWKTKPKRRKGKQNYFKRKKKENGFQD